MHESRLDYRTIRPIEKVDVTVDKSTNRLKHKNSDDSECSSENLNQTIGEKETPVLGQVGNGWLSLLNTTG